MLVRNCKLTGDRVDESRRALSAQFQIVGHTFLDETGPVDVWIARTHGRHRTHTLVNACDIVPFPTALSRDGASVVRDGRTVRSSDQPGVEPGPPQSGALPLSYWSPPNGGGLDSSVTIVTSVCREMRRGGLGRRPSPGQ